MLRSLLSHPLTRDLDLDDPETTILRRQILQEKRFLRELYSDWYASIATELPQNHERVLELGSGAGFLSEYVPNLIQSDPLLLPWTSLVAEGAQLPFQSGSLDAIVMLNVLHHIQKVEDFLREAARCVRRGGKMVMIEPWVTAWSKLVYKQLHHEPFDPEASNWELPQKGPLSSANGALPWIIFERDKDVFKQRFPMLDLSDIKLMSPVIYLLSGGVSMRSLMPAWSYAIWRRFELLLRPSFEKTAMFAKVVLVRS